MSGNKYISVDALSRFPKVGNETTTHDSKLKMETMSKIYDTNEIPKGEKNKIKIHIPLKI